MKITYITKQQVFNSVIWWSICSGQIWSGSLVFQ